VSIFRQTKVVQDAKKDDKDEEEKNNDGSSDPANILKSLGFTIPTLTAAPMTLNALEISNIYGTTGTVMSLLTEHYTSNIKSNLLKLLGSSDLIGNPTDFITTLGTGAKSFYYEPKQGFMKGPVEGGIGLIKGTGALAGGVAAGFAGSFGKITNTVNRGFLTLSFDQEYRHKKEIRDLTEKPKGVFDGVGKGFKGFGMSLFDGVTGVVAQPIKGA
jgi:vacuolar protein sorting-associated protein 13A/C